MIVWRYYETVTRDESGDTVEGDHGIWSPNDEPTLLVDIGAEAHPEGTE